MWSILGVDNGKNGCVCLYTPAIDRVLLAPTPIKVGKLACRVVHQEQDEAMKDYDWIAMSNLVEKALATADNALIGVIESPLSGKGFASGAHSRHDQWRAVGLWSAAFARFGVEPLLLHPTTWKTGMSMIGMPKEYALQKAAELRPKDVWEVVDAADAYLLSYYLAHKVERFRFVLNADA